MTQQLLGTSILGSFPLTYEASQINIRKYIERQSGIKSTYNDEIPATY